IVEAEGLAVVSDDSVLTGAVDRAIADNPDVVAKIQGGKVQAIGALIGPVMKATRGQADAGRVREIIMDKLGVSGARGSRRRPGPRCGGRAVRCPDGDIRVSHVGVACRTWHSSALAPPPTAATWQAPAPSGAPPA